jgi:hypothetical protein
MKLMWLLAVMSIKLPGVAPACGVGAVVCIELAGLCAWAVATKPDVIHTGRRRLPINMRLSNSCENLFAIDMDRPESIIAFEES